MNTEGLILSGPLSALMAEASAGESSRTTLVACASAAKGKGDILHLLGLQSFAGGDPRGACVLIERAARFDSENVAVLNNLGVALLACGNAASAASCLRRAILLARDEPEPHGNLGIALHTLGDHDAAAASLSRTLAADHTPALFRRKLAEVRFEQGDVEEGEALLLQMLSQDGDDTEAVLTLGRLLAWRGEWTEAAEFFWQILRSDPAHLGALCALAPVVDDDRVEELTELLQRATSTAGDEDAQFRGHQALAGLAHLRKDIAAEADHCRRALEYRPDAVEVQVNLAKLFLLKGDFHTGWSSFEWRWRQGSTTLRSRSLMRPRWRGEPLDNATIALHAEQGFGSVIQFARYAPLVAGLGGRVVLEVPPELVRLMRSLDGVEHIAARGEPIPAVAWQCPLMSLPLAFGTTLSTIPANVPYLRAVPEEVRAWSSRLPAKFRIGVAWAGARRHYNDRRRSMRAEVLAPLGEIADVAIISIQLPQFPEPGTLPFDHIDVSAELTDFADTAAVIASLNVLVTVDTAVAHLAGALGIPVWILLPFAGEYRWLLDRVDSPWYPTARLFRQPSPGDWDSVIGRVALELRLASVAGGR